ncbi:hypothetical protein CEQ90_08345 [Lewinellaceae bacterium SD302]|nr:hypothetical protein CEQ90_08345 [Lewinellaceae bacterium SD302]
MKNIFAVKGIGDYLLQVSLIILSLLIATGLNRCNEGRKDGEKLDNYLVAIEKDLEKELSSVNSNLRDAQNDYRDLRRAISAGRHPDTDSLQLSIARVLQVVVRGVYRGFSPTTYELMQGTGDVLLIEDLNYRNQLAAISDFRRSYLRDDLKDHDRRVLLLGEKLGEFVNLPCALENRGNLSCVTDPEGYRLKMGNHLMILYRAVELRLFHLDIAQELTGDGLEATRKRLGD